MIKDQWSHLREMYFEKNMYRHRKKIKTEVTEVILNEARSKTVASSSTRLPLVPPPHSRDI